MCLNSVTILYHFYNGCAHIYNVSKVVEKSVWRFVERLYENSMTEQVENYMPFRI